MVAMETREEPPTKAGGGGRRGSEKRDEVDPAKSRGMWSLLTLGLAQLALVGSIGLQFNITATMYMKISYLNNHNVHKQKQSMC